MNNLIEQTLSIPYSSQKERQVAVEHWLSTLDFKLFGTLIFNLGNLSLDSFRRNLKKLHGYVDEELLGKRFYKKPVEQRSRIFTFVEHIDSNLHGHSVIIPPKNKVYAFKAVAPYKWLKICPRGELNIKRIKTKEGHRKACGYVCKELWKNINYENFIISDEFVK